MISLPCPYCPFSHKNSEEMRACWLDSVAEASGLSQKKSTNQKFITSLPPSPAHGPSALSKNEKNIRAKKRKSNPSSAESVLLNALKDLSSKGYTFKREHSILGYYADFYLPSARLVIEVDGASHKSRRLEDLQRDQVLAANHYFVLRFSAYRVFNEIELVIHEIESWILHHKIPSAKRNSSSKNWSFKPKVTFESLEIDTNSFYVNSDLSVTRKPVSQPTERNTNFDSMRPQKGEFVCQKCIQRKPFVTFGPSPKCRGCNSNEQTTPLCRRCKNPFTFWRQEHQWICRYCSDIRDVSREAASGQRSDITPLRQTRKGKKI